MVSGFQGRPPTQQLMPPTSRQPFDYWGAPFQQGGIPTQVAPVEKSGLMGMLQKYLPTNLLQNTGGGSGVTGTLNNIQQVLKMTQSVTPLIQQYGPMVKNIPSMLALLKAFQESDDEGDEADTNLDMDEVDNETVINTSEEVESIEKRAKVAINESSDDLYHIETEMNAKSKQQTKAQSSKPKLYI
ncbi:VrrA/YqfQ family protein [Paraliobacillus sediminis]|uniref:VrrA/YqfQ family protein n=1 Tax=Paraliobacillus sediminis TaxID=1885916 RepID=UPI000E3D748F|nr:VrrA/YqfQ family protein [Paraliobacillus sediminis]